MLLCLLELEDYANVTGKSKLAAIISRPSL